MPTIEGKRLNFTKKKTKCNCSKTKCNKKYCDCFSNGEHCDPQVCNCHNCINNRPTLSVIKSDNSTHFCNCTKSNCQKFYCECFKNKRQCNKLCRCINCLNQLPGGKDVARLEVYEHINVSIINNRLDVDHYKEQVDTPRLLGRKRQSLGESSNNLVFTTTCAPSSKKRKRARNLRRSSMKRKLVMKEYKNQSIYKKKNN